MARLLILFFVLFGTLEVCYASPLFSAPLSDFHWVAALQETETRAVGPKEHAKSFYHLAKAVEYDPGYFAVYSFGGAYLAVIRSDKDGAQALLEKGNQYRRTELPQRSVAYREKFWSQAWALPLYLAYVQLFEQNDLPKAAAAFEEASQIPGAPKYLSALRDRLAQPFGQYAVGERLLRHLTETTQDDALKETYSKKLRHLEVAYFMAIQRDRVAHRLQIPARDPWGGELRTTPQGEVVTTTAFEPVFGLR